MHTHAPCNMRSRTHHTIHPLIHTHTPFNAHSHTPYQHTLTHYTNTSSHHSLLTYFLPLFPPPNTRLSKGMNVDKDDTTAVATRKEMETKKQGLIDAAAASAHCSLDRVKLLDEMIESLEGTTAAASTATAAGSTATVTTATADTTSTDPLMTKLLQESDRPALLIYLSNLSPAQRLASLTALRYDLAYPSNTPFSILSDIPRKSTLTPLP